MAEILPWHSDVVLRVVKFVRAGIAQQALLAVYPGAFSSSEPTAIALASGQSFPGINTGASGLGYTVLTRGLVCFGAPRDGPSCFMAAPDYRIGGPIDTFMTIKRGVIESDPDGNPELKFSNVGGGTGLIALTFAGKAFHAVYVDDNTTRIETSFDGFNWNSADAFPFSDDIRGTFGGAVAFNGDPEIATSGNYAAAGNAILWNPPIGDAEPVWDSIIENLAWATATAPTPPPPPEEGGPPPVTPLAWSYGFNDSEEGGPGARMEREGTQNQNASTAGGKGIFIAATYEKNVTLYDINPGHEPVYHKITLYTAAVASSSNGGSWDNHVLDGVQEGLISNTDPRVYGESRTIAVIFVRDPKPENSFFVCATYNFHGTSEDNATWVTVHKSYDGKAWTFDQTVEDYCGALSAIAANLDSTTIINL